MNIGVIGAGIAGLACAKSAAERGFEVTIFDKARGPGGRISTRRQPIAEGTGSVADERHFDHGAQYFTARDEAFRAAVREWTELGIVSEWKPKLVSLEDSGELSKDHGPTRYVGVPSMSQIARHMGEQVSGLATVGFGVKVVGLERHGHLWEFIAEDGERLGAFDVVVVALPAPQAVELLGDVPDIRARLRSISMRPCWALMLSFDQRLPVDFDAAFVNTRGLRDRISWVSRNNSKPGRPDHESWIVHAAAEWSRQHLEETPNAVLPQLREAFFEALDLDPAAFPTAVQVAHRWRYALPDAPLCDACLYDIEAGVGACGDWCMGARVEAAYLSGLALADRLVESQHPAMC